MSAIESDVTLKVTIAGLTVALTVPHEGWLTPLLTRLGKFRSKARPDFEATLLCDPEIAAAPGGEPRVEEEYDGLHLRHDNFHGHLPTRGRGCIVVYQTEADPVDATYTMVVDSYLRLCLAQLLAAQGGLMMHAAGIAVSKESGFVFFGPSGSGKTTVCQLSHPRYRILCDEIIAIRPEAGGARLYGTPFNGAWGDSLAEDVPLTELFYLRQAAANRRVPLTTAEAARAVLESAVVYHHSPEFAGHLLDLVFAMLQRVPVTQLEFVPKETLWETVLVPLTP